jgi:transposase
LPPRPPAREKRQKRGARIDPPGFDAGKLVKGKKRHLLVDTLRLLLHALIPPAALPDRAGGILLLSPLSGRFPHLAKLFGEGASAGPLFLEALAKIRPHLTTEIVNRCAQAQGFVVLPKRWIVERTIAWLNRCRRLAKDCENLAQNALAFVQLAAIRLMVRKLCNPS